MLHDVLRLSRYDVADFFDTECRQGEREVEDEPVEESLQDLLFFYFECRQENGKHEPNLCVVQDEAGKEWVFKGDKTRDEFCKWLFTEEHAGCTVMAHNFQGYDSYFILQYLCEQGVKYDVIMCGLSSRVSHQLPSQRYDRRHSAYGILPQEQRIVVCP